MIIPLKVGIITASDRCSRGEREDESGALLISLVEALPAEVIAYRVVPDDRDLLERTLLLMSDLLHCDLVVTTGGTGVGPRDCTPEATRAVLEKEIPGIPQMIREEGMKKNKFAALSRGLAGVRRNTLIINLPGSPDGVRDGFETLKDLLFHAVESIRGEVTDCRKSLHWSHSHS